MRKVLLKQWIPVRFIQTPQNREEREPGTGCWSTEFKRHGVFHKWGSAYEEYESGPANYTVGIIEFEDGTIELVSPSNIKFVKE